MDFETILFKFFTPTIGLITTIVAALNAIRGQELGKAMKELKLRENRDDIRRTIESEVTLTGSEEDFILGYYASDACISIKPNPQDRIDGETCVGIDEIIEYYNQFTKAELKHGQYRHIVDNDHIILSNSSETALAISRTESRKSSGEIWSYAYYQVWQLVKDSEKYYYSWGITDFIGGLSEEEAKAEYRKRRKRVK